MNQPYDNPYLKNLLSPKAHIEISARIVLYCCSVIGISKKNSSSGLGFEF